MTSYPVHLNLTDKICVIVGGGKVAERKVKSLRESGAAVTVIAPDVTVTLREMASIGKIVWREKVYNAGDLDGAFLVIAAANVSDVNAAVSRDAQICGLLICNTDEPERGNWTSPSVVKRGDLTLTVSTNAQSPTLAAVLREHLAVEFGDEWAILTEIFGRLREQIKTIGDETARRKAVQSLLDDDELREFCRHGQLLEAETRARECLLSFSE